MHREANTMLSKTPGVESEALAITGLALEIKAEIEKLRTGTKHRMSMGTEIAPLVLIVSGPSGSENRLLVQRILELPAQCFDLMYYTVAPDDRGHREVL